MEVFARERRTAFLWAALAAVAACVCISAGAQTWVSNSVPNSNWMAVACSADGRTLFAVPWQGRTLFGTSESSALSKPGDSAVDAAAVDGFPRPLTS